MHDMDLVTQRSLVRLYESIALLYALGPPHDGRSRRQSATELLSDECSRIKSRRDFLDNLAFLCNHAKGGPTVSAIAIQKHEDRMIYWIAANEDPSVQISKFLRNLLDDLQRVTSESNAEMLDRVLRKSIDFNHRTIYKSLSLWRLPLQNCLKHLSQVARSGDGQRSATESMLHDLQDVTVGQSHYELCLFASRQTTSAFMTKQSAPEFIRQHSLATQKIRDDFQCVRHHLGRLAAYKYATAQIVDTARLYPAWLHDVTIRSCTIPEIRGDLSVARDLTLDDLTSGTLSIPNTAMRDLIGQSICTHIQKWMGDALEKRKPCVHAELILLEAMWKERAEFLEGDRFIGCSKPACYFCYQYISKHEGRFVVPASHKKAYNNWHPPNESIAAHQNRNETGASTTSDLLTSLKDTVRDEIVNRLHSQQVQKQIHFDSTTGIPSTQPASNVVDPISGPNSIQTALAHGQASNDSDLAPASKMTQFYLVLLAMCSSALLAITVSLTIPLLRLQLPFPIIIPILLILAAMIEHVATYAAYKYRRFFLSMLIWISGTIDILSIAMATSYIDLLPWSLESAWQTWFQHKMEIPVRSLQDRFNCCGFHSTVDRAWPFPDKTHRVDACISAHHRVNSCFAASQDMLRMRLKCCIVLGGIDLGAKISIVAVYFITGKVNFKNTPNPITPRASLARAFGEARRPSSLEEEPLLS